MTDPTHTTNEQIALELGWKRYGRRGWLDPLGNWHEHVPDYEHDWAHAGPLLEEMVTALGAVVVWDLISNELWADTGIDLTQAIAHAWLAWKKEEK